MRTLPMYSQSDLINPTSRFKIIEFANKFLGIAAVSSSAVQGSSEKYRQYNVRIKLDRKPQMKGRCTCDRSRDFYNICNSTEKTETMLTVGDDTKYLTWKPRSTSIFSSTVMYRKWKGSGLHLSKQTLLRKSIVTTASAVVCDEAAHFPVVAFSADARIAEVNAAATAVAGTKIPIQPYRISHMRDIDFFGCCLPHSPSAVTFLLRLKLISFSSASNSSSPRDSSMTKEPTAPQSLPTLA